MGCYKIRLARINSAGEGALIVLDVGAGSCRTCDVIKIVPVFCGDVTELF